MPDILEQLGVNLPPPPVGGLGAQPEKPPIAETTRPTELAGVEALADTMVAGALMLLTQAFPLYGSASEKGDGIIKAINTLKKVVPPEKVKEIEGAVTSVIAGMGRGAPPTPPPEMMGMMGDLPGGAGAPPAGVPTAGAPPTVPTP